jgi:hypothetical protein
VGGGAIARARPPGIRLTARLDPIRLLLSASLWRGAWYLIVYVFATGWLLFAAALTAAITAAFCAVTIAGFPLLAAAAWVLRGCANVERLRLRQVFTEPVRGRYKLVTGGIIAQATRRWRDAATWRDVAYLLGMWVPLFVLDTVVLTGWVTLASLVAAPAWYRWGGGVGATGYNDSHIVHGLALGYFPHGPYGRGAYGVFVGSLGSAIVTAIVGLVLFLLFNYVVVHTARAHARVARALLRPAPDPLAEARDVLARPGPLRPLTPSPAADANGPPAPWRPRP